MTSRTDRPPLDPSILNRLRSVVGADQVRTEKAVREAYGRDETEDLVFPPDAVVLPASTTEVSKVVALAHEARLPIVARGAGTGLSGGALPVRGGLSLSMERMNRVRWIRAEDMAAEVEAGVVVGQLQRQVETLGLLYPPDPGSRDTCLLGGNLAEDAAGPRSIKYGTTRQWVLGLEAVLADGSIVRTGGANRKDATGYDLTQLLVGSEGTLAVITAAVLRLTSKPLRTLVLCAPFRDIDDAARAVAEIFVRGFDPSACEILDGAAIDVVSGDADVPDSIVGAGAMLLLELESAARGSAGASSPETADSTEPDPLLDAAAQLADTLSELGAGEAVVGLDVADQRRLWHIRRHVPTAVRHRSVYKEADTVVPRSKLADLVKAAHRAAETNGLAAVCYGHAGDGNLHVNLLRGDLAEAEWRDRRDRAEAALFAAVIDLGGAITGEHGVGWTQRHHLEAALGRQQVEIMRRIKTALDPHDLLNPGKIFPDPSA